MRSVHHAQVAAVAGADMVGLVLAPARRQVAAALAREITSAAYRRRPRFVGVFVDEPPDVLARQAAELRLDLVQLSGDEPPAYCAGLRVPYMKVIHVRPDATAPDVLAAMASYPDAAAIVLDSAAASPSGPRGGTGQTFNWDIAAEVVRLSRRPIMLAGGLRPDNVARAVREVAPWGVDVSSGVETDGVQDEARIRAFVSAARTSDE